MSVHQRKGGTSWAYKIRIPDPEEPGSLKVKMRSGYRRQGDARRAERFELGRTREREEPEYCYLDPNGVRVAYGPTAMPSRSNGNSVQRSRSAPRSSTTSPPTGTNSHPPPTRATRSPCVFGFSVNVGLMVFGLTAGCRSSLRSLTPGFTDRAHR